MFNESELLPISGLQHYFYCPRRWALVQIERAWEDNRFTAEGRLAHERVHSGQIESRPGVITRRGLPLRSLRLGLVGQADAVEFCPATDPSTGAKIRGRPGFWSPAPIEYKRSHRRRGSSAYDAQLCAQAVCLEEMLGVAVPTGFVYDVRARRRHRVDFTDVLRQRVAKAAAAMHELAGAGRTPPPVLTPACLACSLVEVCQPKPLARHTKVARYLEWDAPS